MQPTRLLTVAAVNPITPTANATAKLGNEIAPRENYLSHADYAGQRGMYKFQVSFALYCLMGTLLSWTFGFIFGLTCNYIDRWQARRQGRAEPHHRIEVWFLKQAKWVCQVIMGKGPRRANFSSKIEMTTPDWEVHRRDALEQAIDAKSEKATHSSEIIEMPSSSHQPRRYYSLDEEIGPLDCSMV